MDFYKRHEAAVTQAHAQALVSVREKGFPSSIQVDPKELGSINEANATAERLGLPFRFKSEGINARDLPRETQRQSSKLAVGGQRL